MAAVDAAPSVSFDTEFVGEKTYEPELCLIQIATGEDIWIIDPLARINLNPFWQALTAPGREVVALAARQEILFCLRYAGRPPATVYDPQLVAGLVGYSYPLSHTNLVQQVLDVRVGGGETFTDWRKRPLSPQQLEYAADDVRYLAAIRDHLNRRAADLGRSEWVATECARQVERVVNRDGEERWMRVSGAGSLPRRGLAVLREVWQWRDDAARAANVPVRRIMSDDLLIAVAKRSPKTVDDLFALRGFDRGALSRSGPAIVAAVQAGARVPQDQLPSLLRRDDPPQVSVLGQFVSVVANNLAGQHQVAASLLATSADLQDLVRWHLRLPDVERPPVLDGWRGEILGQPLLDLLSGRTAVRVTDAQSPNPLTVEPV